MTAQSNCRPLPALAARAVRPMKLRSRILLILLGAAAAMSLSVSAWSYWTSGGSGGAQGVTATLNPPTNVAASAPLDSSTVSVSWTGALMSTGQAASGYYVIRIRNVDSARLPACGTSPSTTTSAFSCNDLGVTDGAYSYSVTAVSGSWTAVGTASVTVSVVNDSSRPTVAVTSISPTPNGNGYNNASPVVVNIGGSDASGIESITYTVDGGSAMTIAGSPIAVSVSGDGIHPLTFYSTDNVGKTSDTGSVLIRIDTGIPAAASAPTMTTATDTGSSTTDGITKNVTPGFHRHRRGWDHRHVVRRRDGAGQWNRLGRHLHGRLERAGKRRPRHHGPGY